MRKTTLSINNQPRPPQTDARTRCASLPSPPGLCSDASGSASTDMGAELSVPVPVKHGSTAVSTRSIKDPDSASRNFFVARAEAATRVNGSAKGMSPTGSTSRETDARVREKEAAAHREAAAFAAYAKAFAQDALAGMKEEVESLRKELAVTQALVAQTQQPLTLEEIRARRRAELEAAEEFAFAGRAAGLPSRLRTAGYSCIEAKAYGYTFEDAKTAGYSLQEMADADYLEARHALARAAAAARTTTDEYTPLNLKDGKHRDEDTDDEGEMEDEPVLPSATELVERWQAELPALGSRTLTRQHTQALSTLAELLTGANAADGERPPSSASTDRALSPGPNFTPGTSQDATAEPSAFDAQRKWLSSQDDGAAMPTEMTPRSSEKRTSVVGNRMEESPN